MQASNLYEITERVDSGVVRIDRSRIAEVAFDAAIDSELDRYASGETAGRIESARCFWFGLTAERFV